MSHDTPQLIQNGDQDQRAFWSEVEAFEIGQDAYQWLIVTDRRSAFLIWCEGRGIKAGFVWQDQEAGEGWEAAVWLDESQESVDESNGIGFVGLGGYPSARAAQAAVVKAYRDRWYRVKDSVFEDIEYLPAWCRSWAMNILAQTRTKHQELETLLNIRRDELEEIQNEIWLRNTYKECYDDEDENDRHALESERDELQRWIVAIEEAIAIRGRERAKRSKWKWDGF